MTSTESQMTARPQTRQANLSFDDIVAAAGRLKGQIERTPMRHSRTLSEITGAEVWVKFEKFQDGTSQRIVKT